MQQRRSKQHVLLCSLVYIENNGHLLLSLVQIQSLCPSTGPSLFPREWVIIRSSYTSPCIKSPLKGRSRLEIMDVYYIPLRIAKYLQVPCPKQNIMLTEHNGWLMHALTAAHPGNTCFIQCLNLQYDYRRLVTSFPSCMQYEIPFKRL